MVKKHLLNRQFSYKRIKKIMVVITIISLSFTCNVIGFASETDIMQPEIRIEERINQPDFIANIEKIKKNEVYRKAIQNENEKVKMKIAIRTLSKDDISYNEYLNIKAEIERSIEDLMNGRCTFEEYLLCMNKYTQIDFITTEKIMEKHKTSCYNSINNDSDEVLSIAQQNYGNLYGNLNAYELDLVTRYPAKAFTAYMLAQSADYYTEEIFLKSVCYKNNGDAFRHAYWSAMMVKDPAVGEDFAYRIGYAHEGFYPGNDSAIVSLDNKMDIENNARGRIIGKQSSPKENMDDLLVKVLNGVKKGKYIRIRIGNKDYNTFKNTNSTGIRSIYK